MAVLYKELKQGFKGLCIWTAAIAFMLVICIAMFPEMSNQMGEVSNIFANMGGFTQAFGLDQLNFGEMIGFYGIECGNLLGIGGGFFAAFIGISVLSKEEKEHTSEFLLTHPISRFSIVLQKLIAVVVQILAMNVVVFLLSLGTIFAIGEEVPMKEFLLVHVAYLILQLEICLICFGISAFLRRGSIGIGLGFAAILYFMNIICNLSKQAEFLKYITPYKYADPANVIPNGSLDTPLILLGAAYAVVGVVIAFVKYIRKDIAS